MNLQTDIFAAGEADSLPPHLDPAKVAAVHVRPMEDRDHVGEQAVGRFGNNRLCAVLEVLDAAGEILHAERFDDYDSAERASRAMLRKLDANRQQLLGLA